MCLVKEGFYNVFPGILSVLTVAISLLLIFGFFINKRYLLDLPKDRKRSYVSLNLHTTGFACVHCLNYLDGFL